MVVSGSVALPLTECLSLLCLCRLICSCVSGSVVLPLSVCHSCALRGWSAAVVVVVWFYHRVFVTPVSPVVGQRLCWRSSSGGVTNTRHIVFSFLMLFCLQGNRLQFYLLYCIGIVVYNRMYVSEKWRKLTSMIFPFCILMIVIDMSHGAHG